MHHRHIYEYVKAYIKKHDLLPNIMFENEVVLIEGNFGLKFKDERKFNK
jgi:hypothetical protein